MKLSAWKALLSLVALLVPTAAALSVVAVWIVRLVRLPKPERIEQRIQDVLEMLSPDQWAGAGWIKRELIADLLRDLKLQYAMASPAAEYWDTDLDGAATEWPTLRLKIRLRHRWRIWTQLPLQKRIHEALGKLVERGVVAYDPHSKLWKIAP